MITKNTFEKHIPGITLKKRLKDAKLFIRINQVLLFWLEDPVVESTSLGSYAYTEEAPEHCILSVLKDENAHMLNNDHHHGLVSGNHSEIKHLFEEENHPQHLCNKSTKV